MENKIPGYTQNKAPLKKWLLLLLSSCGFLISYQLRAQPLVMEKGADSIHFANIPDTHQINKSLRHAKEIIDLHIDSASGIFQQTLLWSKQARFADGVAESILGIAGCEQLKGNNQRSLHWARQALPFCRHSGNPLLILLYYKCLIENFARNGYMDSAIHYCYRALEKIEQLSDSGQYDQSRWYFNSRLGSLYAPTYNSNYEDFHRALYYLERSKLFAIKHRNKRNLIRIYLTLGAVHANRKYNDSIQTAEGYRKGIYYYHQAASLSREVHYDINLGDAYINLGTIYINQDHLDSGAWYIQKAMSIPAFIQYAESRIPAYTLLGLAAYKKGAFQDAERYLLKAQSESEGAGHNIKRAEIAYILYQVYRQQQQNTKALSQLEAYTSLRDSMVNQEKINAVNQWEIKYHTAEKDRQLVENKLSLSRQQSQLREKNILIACVIAGLLLMTGFLFLLYRNMHYRRRRQEEQLQRVQQEQQLWKQGEEIRNLNAMVKGEEKECARLGRELHDGILSELTVVKINLETIQEQYPRPPLRADLRTALLQLDETAIQLRKTAHNLMPEILIQQGLIIAIDSFCEKTSTFTGVRINFHHNGQVPKMDMDFELSIYRMIQELVQNIIKHAAATETLVQLDYHHPLLILTVEDNGKGIQDEMLPTQPGRGLGNLQARVKALQGAFEITGKRNEGTSVYIEFDLSLIQKAINI